jgi:hypothetical protein
VVGSGSGVHAYWLLERDIQSPDDLSVLPGMLFQFYRGFGGDHVQNLSRLMRLPGTVNYKDARNGRPPAHCRLCTCDPELRYPFEAFLPWLRKAEEERRKTRARACATPTTELTPEPTVVTTANSEALALARQLRRPCRDRSRRDFAVVCDLLRLGLTKKQIWPLVCGSSKFATNGRRYFELTIANAMKRILLDESEASQPLVPS